MENPKDVTGKWLYRSFVNNTNPNEDPQLFGQGELAILPSDFGHIIGDFDFGEWGKVTIKGTIHFGNPFQLRFQGRGVKGTGAEDWVYDYIGYYIPNWVEGVNQLPAIVGSVIRTEPHGQSKAGIVASFIMIKMS
ncbi:hypothetical protein [Flavobacterium sp. MDT1-60]|uniref:hypothetical protein n=1 Tax=Flavobacterium sp. MDT1-60 TaxID=1979344 RepID=UPI00177D1AFD|nr:hypothetical protein [Flavobacterium sp. MDT1-60]QOG01123.1 hypothetical protein IHE43_15020 [Flavobacterium sp. MDT1-60]